MCCECEGILGIYFTEVILLWAEQFLRSGASFLARQSLLEAIGHLLSMFQDACGR